MNKRDREEFLMVAVQAGLSHEYARKVARHAATHDRLAVAQCNGDWPADNGERDTEECSRCGCYWHPSTLRRRDRVCKSCSAEAAIQELCDRAGVPVSFQGDPRGWTVKVGVMP